MLDIFTIYKLDTNPTVGMVPGLLRLDTNNCLVPVPCRPKCRIGLSGIAFNKNFMVGCFADPTLLTRK